MFFSDICRPAEEILQKKSYQGEEMQVGWQGVQVLRENKNIFVGDSGYDEQSYMWAWGLRGNPPPESPVVYSALPRQVQFT